MFRFYVLKPEEGIRFGRKWAYAEPVKPKNYADAQQCPVCGSFVSSLRWVEPRRITLSSAKPEKWGDFVWGAGFSLLISQRFKEIYETEGLSGFSHISSPVEVVRVGKNKSGDFPTSPLIYHHVEVPWGGANQDDVASELVHEQPYKIKCSYCRCGVTWKKQTNIAIEAGSWDGSDIFKPRNAPVQFVVSERFYDVAERHKLLNLWLIPVEKYAYDERHQDLWYVHD